MNTDPTSPSVRARRANEAAEWFLRLKEDDVAEAELSRWLDWCADPDNLREFQRTRNAWRSFDQLGPAASELLETLLSDKETPVNAQADNLAGSLPAWRPYGAAPSRRWSVPGAAIAAALVLVTVCGAWYAFESRLLSSGVRSPVLQNTIRASVLPDGSALTLSPRTEVTVDFAGPQRNLSLSHGEAFFKVHPDKSKPFVVQTAGLRVTAVGTAFDVHSRSDRVVVTVQEGIVEVARMNGAAASMADKWRVSAGYQISYDASTNAARIFAVDADRALAWREGRLEYFSEPMTSVVADVSRYSKRPIEIGDSRIATLSFTGTVFTDSVDDWLAAVQATFPVRVVITQDDHVLLLSSQ